MSNSGATQSVCASRKVVEEGAMRLDVEESDCLLCLMYDHHELVTAIIKPIETAFIPWSYVQPQATR
jgi:hypothetical protein